MPNEVRGLLYVDDRYRMQDVRVDSRPFRAASPARSSLCLACAGSAAQADRVVALSTPQDNARIPAHRRAPGPGMPSKSTSLPASI
ncbi:hypothetical protein THAOC_01654 [Thalassiosira oceanica]|uniref:Uncharacterized protein n=1 Tax=Thalassiosira oceanica TaxID=159749 RepID=K0TGN4_THAOC|nr:hypothetical protein THAOC_01654 [Thalassiosira oceanica]|eukprot:EJK76575.1 hypothetical protein THAOC_01654 [Thalassiosira oceanica]